MKLTGQNLIRAKHFLEEKIRNFLGKKIDRKKDEEIKNRHKKIVKPCYFFMDILV